MNAEQIVNLIVAILAGLATCIPLAYNLVKYVKKAAQEKNWNALLGLVMELMEQVADSARKSSANASRVLEEMMQATIAKIHENRRLLLS